MTTARFVLIPHPYVRREPAAIIPPAYVDGEGNEFEWLEVPVAGPHGIALLTYWRVTQLGDSTLYRLEAHA